MGKFVITKDKNGEFNLRVANGDPYWMQRERRRRRGFWQRLWDLFTFRDNNLA